MALRATLNAERRTKTGKGVARKLRAGGQVPAVVYGPGAESVSLSLETREVENLFESISVDNTIVSLAVKGEDDEIQTLVRDIQTHPYRPAILHVDFFRIQEGVAVQLEVPVHLLGTPIGVKEEGGVMEQVVHDLPIRCVPALIPESIDLDVSHLTLGDSLHVSDLDMPEGVEVLLEEERTVCSVLMPKLVLEEPEVDEEEDVEVLRVGEEEEAAEETEAGADEEPQEEGEG